jgi:hypothetical protein
MRPVLTSLLPGLIGSILIIGAVRGATFIVPDDFLSVQSAINACSAGDSVLVLPGVFEESLELPQLPITLTGSDPGDSTTVAATIIDAGGVESALYVAPQTGRHTVISGLTLTGGQGRVYRWGSSHATGGITVDAGASRAGGGIYCDTDASPHIRQCIIRDNSVSEGEGRGGGIYCASGAAPIIDASSILNNVASGQRYTHSAGGGGVYCANASPLIADCVIRGNSAPGWENFAGGVYVLDGEPRLERCRIIANQASGCGAMTAYHDCLLTLEACKISDNTTNTWGAGAIQVGSHNTVVKANNCLFSGNYTPTVGSVMDNYWYGDGQFVNCTFTDNYAAGGDHVLFYSRNFSGNSFTSCVLWNNGTTIPFSDDVLDDVYYCLIEGGYSRGTGILDADPLFRAPAASDFHLSWAACGDPVSSPAIDMGDPAASDAILACDAGLDGSACDMGAYGGADPCDLSARVLSFPESIARGSSGTLFGRIRNACEGERDFDTVLFQISGAWSGSYTVFGPHNVVLPGRNGVARYLDLPIPAGFPTGMLDIVVEVQRTGVVVATDSVSIEITP